MCGGRSSTRTVAAGPDTEPPVASGSLDDAATAAASRSAVNTSVLWWPACFSSAHNLNVSVRPAGFSGFALHNCISARLAHKDGDLEILDGSWEVLVHAVTHLK
jgi:hypothetical protein